MHLLERLPLERFRTGARPRRADRCGFSLVELAIVVSILTIIAVLAWTSLQDNLPRYRMIQAGKALAGDIQKLRMTAISANLETRLYLEEADPGPSDPDEYGGIYRLQAGNRSNRSTSWEALPVDALEDNSDDEISEGFVDLGPEGNEQTRWVGLAPWTPLTGPHTGNADAVVFTPRGWVDNPASDFDDEGYITLRLVNKRALAKGIEDELHIRIARSGYTRLETTLGDEREDYGVGTEEASSRGS